MTLMNALDLFREQGLNSLELVTDVAMTGLVTRLHLVQLRSGFKSKLSQVHDAFFELVIGDDHLIHLLCVNINVFSHPCNELFDVLTHG